MWPFGLLAPNFKRSCTTTIPQDDLTRPVYRRDFNFFHYKLLYVYLPTMLIVVLRAPRLGHVWDARGRMLNPKTNEAEEKKDGKWSPTLFCAIMHGTGVFFLRFRHNARHDVSAPNKGSHNAFPRLYSTTPSNEFACQQPQIGCRCSAAVMLPAPAASLSLYVAALV